MTEKDNNNTQEEEIEIDREKYLAAKKERDAHKYETITEDISGPTFMPTFHIKAKLYPLPIGLVVLIAGFLAYMTYVVAEVQVEGVPFSEEEGGAGAALLNGLYFIIVAAVESFIIIFIIKKKGINALKVIFALSFGFLCFMLLWFFGEIFLWLYSPTVEFYYIGYWIMMVLISVVTAFLLYKYVKEESQRMKNVFVILVGLLIGAFMGIVIPEWTTIFILILFSVWDIFAVKSKRGPIKKMMDLVFENYPDKKKRIEELTEDGEYEVEYDISSLELGIGDLVFYSMLTSSALIYTNNIGIMIATAIAVIIGTGITILGLKKNRILPGLPISIFLGLGTMFIASWIAQIV